MFVSIENNVMCNVQFLEPTKAALGEVTKQIIANCFHYAGFKTKEEYNKKSGTATAQNSEIQPSTSAGLTDSPTQVMNDKDELLMDLLQMNMSNLKRLSLAEFVMVDDHLLCYEG